MTEDFSGKTVLVTGGNSGIGRGIAHRFARAGAYTIIVARDANKGAAVVAELGRSCAEFHSVDLADENQVERLLQSMETKFSCLDVVVNNAGLGSRRGGVSAQDGPGVRWEKMRGPNLDAAYFVSAYALPLLARAQAGAIVNISSTATLHGNWGTYGIAKAGIEALTRAFAAEGAPHGVRANCIAPGRTETRAKPIEEMERMQREEEAEKPGSGRASSLGRFGRGADMGNAVAFLMSERAGFITGACLDVTGGIRLH